LCSATCAPTRSTGWWPEPTALVHLAAVPGLRTGQTRLYDDCNRLATARVAAAATRGGVRTVVHASTSSVYGRVAAGDEQQSLAPVSDYGRTKLAAEAAMRDAGAVVLRYFSVYGPGQRPDMAFHRFCEAIVDGRPLLIHGDGRQERANTYVDDVVDATVAALTRGRPGGWLAGRRAEARSPPHGPLLERGARFAQS
jgi:nucleoside-diphosphate-sugar epimerase